MAIEHAIILYPVRFDSVSSVLRVTEDPLGSPTTEDLAFPAVTLDRDYFNSGDSLATVGAEDLLPLLETMLETHSGITAVTATLDSSFKIRLEFVPTNVVFRLEWSTAPATTLDGTIFGFDALSSIDSVGSGSNEIVAPNQPFGIWRPSRPIATDSEKRQPVVGGVAETISGKSRVSRIDTPRKVRDIGWQRLAESNVREEHATIPHETGERFWVDSLSRGREFRLYESDLNLATNAFELYKTRAMGDPQARSADGRPIFWDFTTQLRRGA